MNHINEPCLQYALNDWAEHVNLPGLVTLVAQNGRIIHQASHGKLNLEKNIPMRSDAIFRIHSMTKPITCAAVMMLWEEGCIRLDDPIKQWIPAFGETPVYAGENNLQPLKTDITLQHLMTHTAGLSYGSYDDPVDAQYRALFKDLGLESLNPVESVSLETFCNLLAKIPLAFQPGTQWRYSLSVDVLGHIIEQVSGQSLDSFLQERIFEPLGMVDTGFQVPESALDRFTTLYTKKDETFIGLETPENSRYARSPRFLEGGGGLVSTPQDYLRFLQMLLNGGILGDAGLLEPETVDWMMQNQLAQAVLPISFQHSDTLKGCGFGIGFDVLIDPDTAGHNAAHGVVSWSGAASTGFWIDPQEQLIGLVFGQSFPNAELQRSMMDVVYDHHRTL